MPSTTPNRPPPAVLPSFTTAEKNAHQGNRNTKRARRMQLDGNAGKTKGTLRCPIISVESVVASICSKVQNCTSRGGVAAQAEDSDCRFVCFLF